MLLSRIIAVVTVAVALQNTAVAQSERDYISILTAFTTYPAITAVAERAQANGQIKAPKIVKAATRSGIQQFCAGPGLEVPDLVATARRMQPAEWETCEKNGVKEIIEIPMGIDGIVIAQSVKGPPLELTLKDLYLALTNSVPDPGGTEKLVSNPYQKWNQVNSRLPDLEIRVFGPLSTTGTRDAFVSLVIEAECKKLKWIEALQKTTDDLYYTMVCQYLRKDGLYSSDPTGFDGIVAKLEANPNALGITSYVFLKQNVNILRGVPIQGKQPVYEDLAAGTYPLIRQLFVYLNKAHLEKLPAIKQYAAELISEGAIGANGYLLDKGIIPLTLEQRNQVRVDLDTLKLFRSAAR